MKKFLIILFFVGGVVFAQEGIWVTFGFDNYSNKIKSNTPIEQNTQTSIPYIGFIWHANFISLRVKGGIIKTNSQTETFNFSNGTYFGIEFRLKIFEKKGNKKYSEVFPESSRTKRVRK